HDAIRPQGRAGRPHGGILEFQEDWREIKPHYAVSRTRQKLTTRSAVEGIKRRKLVRTFSISADAGMRAGPSRSRIKARTVGHSSPIALAMIRTGSLRSPAIRRSTAVIGTPDSAESVVTVSEY